MDRHSEEDARRIISSSLTFSSMTSPTLSTFSDDNLQDGLVSPDLQSVSGDSSDSTEIPGSFHSMDFISPTLSEAVELPDVASLSGAVETSDNSLLPSIIVQPLADMSSEEKDSSIKLPKLSPGTFPRWNRHLMIALTTRGLVDFVKTDATAPTEAIALDKFIQSRARVLEIIVGSIDATYDQLLDIEDTPKKAYDKLAKAHGSNDGVLTAAVICEIASLRLETGQSLADYVSTV